MRSRRKAGVSRVLLQTDQVQAQQGRGPGFAGLLVACGSELKQHVCCHAFTWALWEVSGLYVSVDSKERAREIREKRKLTCGSVSGRE